MSTKKTIFINSNTISEAGTSSDTYREKFGTWAYTDTGIRFSAIEETNLDNVGIEYLSPREIATYPSSIRDSEESDQLVTCHLQTVIMEDTLPYGERSFYQWQEFITSNLPTVGVNYEYLVSSYTAPLTSEEAILSEADLVGSAAGVKYVYNYLDKDYEEEVSTITEHTILPNMYDMFDSNSIVGTDKAGDEIEDADILPVGRGGKSQTLTKQVRANKGRQAARQRFTNQIIPLENMKLLADYEGSKYLYPMYVDINIPLDEKNEFAQAMKDSSMGIAFTRDVEGVPDQTTEISEQTVYFSTINKSYRTRERIAENFNIPVKNLNILNWWYKDSAGYADDPLVEPSYPLPSTFSAIGTRSGEYLNSSAYDDGTDSVTTALGENNQLSDALQTFKDEFVRLAESNRLEYQDIIGEGPENYSEILMYKIEKSLGPISPTGIQTPIQTFHFMNSAEVEEFLSSEREFKLVDTQVKYGVEYVYTISAYVVVVGLRYRYSNLRTYEEPAPGIGVAKKAAFDVYSVPTLKLIEIPLFASSGKILDNPPLQPEIRFFPLVGDRNKLNVFFTTSTGQEEAVPVSFSDQEAADFQQILINQGKEDERVTFKTDDHASAFQAYRLTSPPTSLEDFANNLYATISTSPAEGQAGLDASSATLAITQVPNEKYYYVFRTVDYHNNVSNPSTVYEIELYNDGGAGYPIIREYVIGSSDPTTRTKGAKKIIQIVPRISQVFLNELESGLVNEDNELQTVIGRKDIVLGNQEQPLFGKKFKVRLTSKNTGKKLDLNISFNTKRIKGEIES